MVSPDLRDLPAALIITAEYDVLRDEGKAYAEALRAAGNDASYACYPGLPHGVMTLMPEGRESAQAMEQGAAAIRRALS